MILKILEKIKLDKVWTISFFDQCFVSLFNFIINIYLVKILGLENYGIYILIWSSSQFLILILSSFIIAPSQTFVPKFSNIKNRNNYIGHINLLFLILIILFSFIILLILNLILNFENFKNLNINYLFFYIITFIIFDILRKFFFIIEKNKFILFIDLLFFLTLFFIFKFSYKSEVVLEEVLKYFTFSFLISIFLFIIYYPYKILRFKKFFEIIKKVWLFSKWLFYGLIFNWFNGNYIFYLTSFALGSKEVGAIRAAQNIIGITHIFFQLIENILPIKLSNYLKNKNKKFFLNYLFKFSFYMNIWILLIGIIIFIFAEDIILLIYKNLDENIKLCLLMFLPVYLAISMNTILRAALKSLEKTKAIFRANFYSAIIIFLISYFFVSTFKIYGSMFSLILVNMIIMLSLIISYNKVKKFE